MGNTSVKPHPRTRHKKQVHWKAADRPSPPGKPQLVSESEITPDVVTIRWDPPRYDGGSPIAGYLVEHRRYGSPHWVRATPLLVPFTELSLSGLEPGWRYQFRISAENAVGLSAPGELSELLTVTLQRSAITAPRFIDELKDSVALENEKVEFIARFLGQPAPKICWFKDGFEIFSSRRIRITTENDRSVLTIHQSALSDEGEIKCTATNRAGHVSTKAKLNLEAPPSIRLPRQYEDGLLFELGEVIRLKVSIAGRPTPLIFWTHNNESIKNDERYEIETTDKFSSVRIEEASRTDRGEYHIRAVNTLGEAIASFLVTVTDKPSPPERARVVMTLGRSVTLSWNIPEDDGGCKIGNYIVEYFRLGWDVWLKAATCRQLTTTIGDLIEGSEYKFRIKAESPYGVSEPSDESDVVFIPDPKRGILTPSARSRSQPRDVFGDDFAPVPKKRQPRSQSSTRADTLPRRTPTPVHFYEGGIPVRPARTKVKSPSITPEPSPGVSRRNIPAKPLDKNIFDRASMARDLAYGTPGREVHKSETAYDSEKLNQIPNAVVKSTVNVIHHQNPNPIISRRASSPVAFARLERPTSPPPRSKSPVRRDAEIYPNFIPKSSSPRQRSPSPVRKFQSPRQRSPSPVRKLQSPRQRSPSPVRKFPSPRQRSPSPVRKLQSPRQRSPSPVRKFQSPRQRSPSPERKFQSPRQRSPSPIRKLQNLRQKSPSPQPFSTAYNRRSPSPLPQSRRSPSPSPQIRRSPSPIRFQHSSRDRSPSPLRYSKSRSPSPNRNMKHEAVDPKYNLNLPQVPRSNNDTLSNSSEFMLVLLPEKQRGRGSATELKFDFDENAVPPPISLSAPELGTEPLMFEPLRTAVSSSELLYEHAMERFYQAMAAEEAELEKMGHNNTEDNFNRRSELPKIQINSRDDQVIVGLERKNSLRRRLSAGGLTGPQQILWAQRRHSLRNPDLTEIPENNLRKYPEILDNETVIKAAEEDNLRKFPASSEDKREVFSRRQRSESEEREEEEFEKVRAKMAAQKKDHRKGVEVLKEEDWDEVAEDEEPEYEESISESETDSSEDERLRRELEKPPLYVSEQEETYHPRLMRPKVENHQKSKSDEPFEILTKPSPLPDPNFIPKPILKRRDVEDIPEKPIRKSINTNSNTPRQRSLSMYPQTTTKPKEAHYELENNSRQRSFSLFPQNNPSRSNREVPAMRKRGRSPAVPNRNISAALTEISGMTAASVAMPQPSKPPVPRKKSEEEIKVVVDHYGDIVRSYGQKKKTIPQVYLTADDLKAEADRQSKEDLREIGRSMENLANQEDLNEESLEGLELPTDPNSRRRSFVIEASSALFRTVKDRVSAALAGGEQEEDDIIPPDAEPIPSMQRRGSAQITAQMNKRRLSKNPGKVDTSKAAKKGGGGSSESNWSNLRAPSPGPQGRRSSASPMRRHSLIPPTVRKTSFGNASPSSGKPKMRETTTQTAGYDDSQGDPKKDVLLAARQELLSAKAEYKVRSTVDYITDLAMFIVACWLYLFTNELLAIPVLLVMVYRQLKEEIKKKLPRWMLGKKKVKRK